MSLTTLTAILIILLSIALVHLLLRGLKYAFQKSGYPPKQQTKLLFFTGLGLICWLGILAVFSYLGVFNNFQTLPPRIGIAIFPTLVLIFALVVSKRFFQIIQRIPPGWFIYIQSFRIVVEVILWLGLLAGFVPFQMTFEGFNYDIIVGVTALMAGYVFFLKGRIRKWQAMMWNIFGIMILINIVVISILSTPSPFRIFMNEPANIFMGAFPYIWIPGFLVPFALAMHLFSMKQLWYFRKKNQILNKK